MIIYSLIYEPRRHLRVQLFDSHRKSHCLQFVPVCGHYYYSINAITGVYIFETTLLGLTVINIIIENSTVSYLKRIMLFKICLEYIQAFVLLLHGNITISVIYVLNRFTIFKIIL